MSIELHWSDGHITITGIPPSYRYLLAFDNPPHGRVPAEKIIVNEVYDYNFSKLLRFPLREGGFIFRARTAGGFSDPNFEFDGNTGMLPVRLLGWEQYEQIEFVEGIDEFPDPRTRVVER